MGTTAPFLFLLKTVKGGQGGLPPLDLDWGGTGSALMFPLLEGVGVERGDLASDFAVVDTGVGFPFLLSIDTTLIVKGTPSEGGM